MSGHRSRTNRRERAAAAVETTDPAALAAYAEGLRPIVTRLRDLTEDATAPTSQRVHARVYLRAEMLKALRALEARIDVVAPPAAPDPEPSDPAGCGGSPSE